MPTRTPAVLFVVFLLSVSLRLATRPAFALAQSAAPAGTSAPRNAPCTQVAAGMTYDVVAIHPNRSEDGQYSASWGDDRYHATNILPIQLVGQAYSLREDQIVGITGPVANVHYDIEAKVLPADPAKPVKLTDRQLECMLIPLLADRFHLKAHTEVKTMPVFDLVPAKSGAKLTAAASDAAHGNMAWNWDGSTETLTATGVPMSDFVSMLAQDRQRDVIDKTDLHGRYTFSLKWVREGTSDTPPDAPPGLFTALEEQLGLRLQPAKGPVETLVVDRVETPTEN